METDLEQLKNEVQELRFIIDMLVKPNKYLFQRDVEIFNGKNLTHDIGGKVGFFGQSAVAQPASGTGRQDLTSNSGSAMNVGCQFNGNTGTTYYSVGDVVYALKTLGLLKL